MRHSEPEYVEITPELRQRLEKFRDEHSDDSLGNVGNTILFEDDQFRGICRAVGRDDLIDDPRCANLITRIAHAKDLFAILEAEIAKWPTAELLERGRRFGAPVAPANGIREFLCDPQVKINRTIFEVEDERAGRMRQLRNPVRFQETPANLRRLPPRLGQHTDEVLGEAGYSDDEIRALRGADAVA